MDAVDRHQLGGVVHQPVEAEAARLVRGAGLGAGEVLEVRHGVDPHAVGLDGDRPEPGLLARRDARSGDGRSRRVDDDAAHDAGGSVEDQRQGVLRGPVEAHLLGRRPKPGDHGAHDARALHLGQLQRERARAVARGRDRVVALRGRADPGPLDRVARAVEDASAQDAGAVGEGAQNQREVLAAEAGDPQHRRDEALALACQERGVVHPRQPLEREATVRSALRGPLQPGDSGLVVGPDARTHPRAGDRLALLVDDASAELRHRRQHDHVLGGRTRVASDETRRAPRAVALELGREPPRPRVEGQREGPVGGAGDRRSQRLVRRRGVVERQPHAGRLEREAVDVLDPAGERRPLGRGGGRGLSGVPGGRREPLRARRAALLRRADRRAVG